MPFRGPLNTTGRRSRSRASALLAAVTTLVVAVGAAAGPWPPWAEEDTREPTYPGVTTTVDELAGRRGAGDLVVVDARPRATYLSGHVPGAISIPASDLPNPPESVAALAEHGLTGREEIVCYGEASFSVDAARFFWLLDAAGAERVSVLEGGASAWSAAGLELAREERALAPAAWEAKQRPDRVADRAYVALRFGEEGLEIIDARGWQPWEGAAATPTAGAVGSPTAGPGAPGATPRTGHVPHALPFDFRDLFLPDGRTMPAEDAREILAAFGPRPSTPVDLWGEFVVHDDGLSGEGAIGYFLLRRSGVAAVRYYPGGWREWAADPSLPVVRIVHAEELDTRLARERRWFHPNAPPSTFALFDVRHRRDFEGGHIPGAVNLSSRVFADSLEASIGQRWPDLDRREAPIVTYCYGPDCIRSRDCATAAARRGFLNVLRFYGGIVEWRENGGRIVSGR